jgi:phasin family protein
MAGKPPIKRSAVAPAKAAVQAPVAKAEAAKPVVKAVKPEPVKPAPVVVEPAVVEPAVVESAPLAATIPEPVEVTAPLLPPAPPVMEPISQSVASVSAPAAKTAPAALPPGMKGIAPMVITNPPKPQAAAEKVKLMIADFNDRTKAAFEKTAKAGEELTEFTKGNMEALATSAKTAAKGAEALGQEIAEYGKKSFETASATMKSLAAVKTPTEMFQIQSDFAKSSFDSAVAEASKLSEAWLKLAGDVFQPISSRYALAAEKIKSASL